jgi:tungstate transport system substrate-binding protein
MQSTDDFSHARGGPGRVGFGRRFVLGGLAALALAPAAAPSRAGRPRSLDDPLLVGVDQDLMQSGLARALQRAFGRDTGIAARLEAAPAAQVLERLERGELDATLTNSASAERRLLDEGLAHDRQRVAVGRFLLVGPPGAIGAPVEAPASPATRAKAAPETDVIAVLQRIARDGGSAGVRVLSRQDGSGVHLAEQALWRSAGIAPQGVWYLKADPTLPLLRQAREAAACVLVDAALWAPAAAPGLAVLVDVDPRLRFDVHLMRSFRVHHPAAQLFTRWVAGGKGRRVVSSVRGYSAGTA